MSFFRSHRRVTAFLFALTFVTVSTKGLCLMPAAGGGQGDAHACCKKGLQSALPACCMDAQTDQTPATLMARGSGSAPSVATVSPLAATDLFVPSALQFAFDTDRRHSPPPKTILRV